MHQNRRSWRCGQMMALESLLWRNILERGADGQCAAPRRRCWRYELQGAASQLFAIDEMLLPARTPCRRRCDVKVPACPGCARRRSPGHVVVPVVMVRFPPSTRTPL